MKQMALVKRDSLEILLNRVKRPQNIGGKPQDQVHSCILRLSDGRMSVTSLVKDGVSSVSRFSCEAVGENGVYGTYFVSDINTLLGVLKYHGTDLSLDSHQADKLRVKSSNKQTTLASSGEALAYPHSPKTLADWESQSVKVASSLKRQGGGGAWYYEMKNGTIKKATHTFSVSATQLFEALRCDSMNGQKINRYTFHVDGDKETLQVEVGKSLKGRTKSDLACEGQFRKYSSFDATFEGGLEQLMSTVGGSVGLSFFDFSKEGQGRKLLIDFGNRDFVFQSAIQ